MGDDPIVISRDLAVTPETVMNQSFTTAFRGWDPAEVRQFLRQVSEEMVTSAGRESALRRALQQARAAARPDVGEDALVKALGEHAAALIAAARGAAVSITADADRQAKAVVDEADVAAGRIRDQAESLWGRRTAEADTATEGVRRALGAEVESRRERAQAEAVAIVEAARAEGRQMVAEARALRERMLADLAGRRRAAQVQVEQLRAARQRLLAAHDVVRRTLDEATTELAVSEPEARTAAEEVARRAREPTTPDPPSGPADVRPPPVDPEPSPPAAHPVTPPATTVPAPAPQPPMPPELETLFARLRAASQDDRRQEDESGQDPTPGEGPGPVPDVGPMPDAGRGPAETARLTSVASLPSAVPPTSPGPSEVPEIVILCTGNMCCSPVAEALLRRGLAEIGAPARLRSAGLHPGGRRADASSVEVLRRRGLNLRWHRSAPATPALLRGADLVLGMAPDHVDAAVTMAADVWSRTFTLKELVRRGEAIGPRRETERFEEWVARAHAGLARGGVSPLSELRDTVVDPRGQSIDAFEQMAADLEASLDRLIALVWPHHQAAASPIDQVRPAALPS